MFFRHSHMFATIPSSMEDKRVWCSHTFVLVLMGLYGPTFPNLLTVNWVRYAVHYAWQTTIKILKKRTKDKRNWDVRFQSSTSTWQQNHTARLEVKTTALALPPRGPRKQARTRRVLLPKSRPNDARTNDEHVRNSQHFFNSSILQLFDSSNSSILQLFDSSSLQVFDSSILRFFDSSSLRPKAIYLLFWAIF
jgi:hypothetical protein